MNYMNMVTFITLTKNKAMSKLCCQKREAYFRDYFDNIKIVPIFIILEAIFQTAGGAARSSRLENTLGGVIACYRKFNFYRPIMANEEFFISAELRAEDEKGSFYEISVAEDINMKKIIMENGTLIVSKYAGLSKDILTSSSIHEIPNLIKEFKFV